MTQLSADTISWTAVVVPSGLFDGGCHRLSLECAAAFKTRTDPGDATSERTWYSPMVIGEAGVARNAGRWRFLSGETVLWIQMVTGTGPVSITWGL